MAPKELPTLTTARLKLRPFALPDAPRVQQLAGAWEVADTTLNIPHPYPDGAAEEWIATHAQAFAEGKGLTLAVTLADGLLIGAISLMDISLRHRRAELGYWIGKEYWNHGYCTEAAAAVSRFGFESLNLNRIFARCFSRNPASARVMQKLGMKHEGCLRQHSERWAQFEDTEFYGLLRSEWLKPDQHGPIDVAAAAARLAVLNPIC